MFSWIKKSSSGRSEVARVSPGDGLLSGRAASLSSIFTLEDSLTGQPSAAEPGRRTRRVSKRILSIFRRKPRKRLEKDSSGNESGINLTEEPVTDFSMEKGRRTGRKLFGRILETRGGRKLFPGRALDARKLQISQDSGYEGQSSFSSSSSSASSSHSSLLTTEESEFVSSSPLAKIAPRGGSRGLSRMRTLRFHTRPAFLQRRSSRKFKKFSITACEPEDITRSMSNLREGSRMENRVSFLSDPGTVQVTEDVQVESISKSADCVEHIRLNKETCTRCATSLTKLTRQIKRRISWGLQSGGERTTEDRRLIEESEDDASAEINECVDSHEGIAEDIEDSVSVNSSERLALNEDLSRLKRRGISKSAADLFENELMLEHGEEIERFDSFSDFSCVRLRNERERRSAGNGETEDQCVSMNFQDEEDDEERLKKSLYSNSYVLTMYI